MIEDGALGGQAHEERDQSEERRQEEEAEAAQEDVRAPLQHPVPPRDGRLVQADDGQPLELLHGRPEGHELEHVGHHLHVEQLPLDGVEGLEHLGVRVHGQGEEELVHPVVGEDPGHLLGLSPVEVHRDLAVAVVPGIRREHDLGDRDDDQRCLERAREVDRFACCRLRRGRSVRCQQAVPLVGRQPLGIIEVRR